MASTRLGVVLALQCFACHYYVIGNTVDFEKSKDIVTVSGIVRGHLVENGEYFAFLGIPYAAAPTGRLRFQAPLPPQPWNTTFIADRKVVCPQTGIGEEDCLVVNVFVPTGRAGKENGKLPVLVYIHGGQFLTGGGPTEGVEPLTELGVIVVTINYRLGPLGYLCLRNYEAPGNAGLKDQVAALKWVKENIINFGGDKDHVTLYGTDAGAACVEFLLLSKSNGNLFQKAILESGSGSSVWATDKYPLSTAKELARAFTVSDIENPHKLLELYRNVPAQLLNRMNTQYVNTLTDGTVGFAPCIEWTRNKDESILSRTPGEVLQKGHYTLINKNDKLPIIFIFASFEGLFMRSKEYYSLNYKNRMEANFAEFLPADLTFGSESQKYETAKRLKHFYFGNKTIEENIVQYLNYFGDSLVLRPLLNSAEIHARRGGIVYLMEFAYSGNMGDYDELYKSIGTAGHSDFINYVLLKRPVQTSSDQLTINRAAMLMANFLKYGNPTPNQTNAIPTLWPPVQPHVNKYLHFGTDLTVLNNPYRKRREFWNQLYYDSNMNREAPKVERNNTCC